MKDRNQSHTPVALRAAGCSHAAGPRGERVASGVALIIDADNLDISAQTVLRRTPDYKRLLCFASRYGQVVHAEAFAERKPTCSGQQRFFGSIKQMGYCVRSHARKHLSNGQTKSAPTDTDIAFRLGQLLGNQRISTLVIGSGDSDFARGLAQLRQAGVRIVAIGPNRCTSSEIRHVANEFHYLSEVGTMPTRKHRIGGKNTRPASRGHPSSSGLSSMCAS